MTDASTPAGLPGPRFSIVVPALDEADTIAACLESLLAQDVEGGVEIIVADNNSSDATAEVARSYGVTVVHAPLPGVCHARQRGTECARGDIVVSADADTTYEPGWLAGIDAYLRAHPAHVGVGGPCTFDDGPPWSAVYTTLLFALVHRIYRITGLTLYVSATNLAFRRSAFTGYDVGLTQGGDELDLLRKLRRHGTVGFQLAHPSHSSSRRMTRGFAYSMIITFFYYYFLGYNLNRLFGRTIIGTAPAIRPAGARPGRRWPSPVLAVPILAVLGLAAVGWLGWELV